MKRASEVVALFYDTGLFLPLARKLGTQFSKVYYFTHWMKGFPVVNDAVIGEGFPEIERVDDIWDVVDQIDLSVFPDIQNAGLQLHLEGMGIPVWGSRNGDRLETRRQLFHHVLEEVGLPVPKYETIVGLSKLTKYLMDKENKFIKISKYRGSLETYHWKSWRQDGITLYYWGLRFGLVKDLIPFMVFDALETDLEIGGDTYCVDGQWPSIMLHGDEYKDKAYLGAVTNREDMPDQIKEVLDAFGTILKDYRYRNQWSMELRVVDDKAYFIDPTCFSQDTQILTEQGWKYFYDLENLDKVATLNPKTRQIEYQRPTKHISYIFDGEMISISSPTKVIDLLVTPNHSVWFEEDGVLKECSADSIKLSGTIPRTGIWKGKFLATYTVPEYKKEWHCGKGKGIDKIKYCPARKIPADIWLKFLAIFLSEGCVHNWQVQIYQTKHKELFRDIINSLGFTFSENRKGFTIHSIQLANHLSSTGLRHERAIPNWIKSLCSEQIRMFLNHYIIGDGSIRDKIITTTSIKTADDIQELLFKCGSVGDIKIRSKSGSEVLISDRKYKTKHDSLLIVERQKKRKFYFEGWNISRQKYLKRVPYKGKVYDVEVPNHIVYVRRNGKACFSGNCRGGLPSSASQMELWGNIGDIIWHGANGELIDPVPTAKFSAECALAMKSDKHAWGVVEIPKAIEPFVKIASACMVDGVYGLPPDDTHDDEIGWMVATGDTIPETIDNMKKQAEQLPDGVHAKIHPLTDLLKEVHMAEEQGIEFTDQTVPEPEIVVK